MIVGEEAVNKKCQSFFARINKPVLHDVVTG